MALVVPVLPGASLVRRPAESLTRTFVSLRWAVSRLPADLGALLPDAGTLDHGLWRDCGAFPKSRQPLRASRAERL